MNNDIKKYEIVLENKVKKQILKLQKDKKLFKKLLETFKILEFDPYSKIHKFERLKFNHTGYCSMRLSKKDRLVYKVEEEKVIVIIVSVLGHYED
jgi:toxin YoeB